MLQNKPGSIFNNYECLFILSPLIQWLQGIFSLLNVYGILIFLLNACAIYNLILLLFQTGFMTLKRPLTCIFGIGLFLLILTDYTFIQFTKTAIYYNFIGLYLMIRYPVQYKKSLLFILIGLLLRAETFWFIAIYISIIFFIADKSTLYLSLVNNKYKFGIILLCAVLISVCNKKIYTEDDLRYADFRGYKYTVLDFGQSSGTQQYLNGRDSIKLEVLEKAFFGDRDSLVNIETFKKLKLIEHERFDFKKALQNIFTKKTYTDKLIVLYYLLLSAKVYYLFYVLLMISMFYFVLRERRYSLFNRVICILIAGTVYILLITVYIKMEARVLNPFLLITLLFFVFVFSRQPINNKHVSADLFFILLLSGGIFLQAYDFFNKTKKHTVFRSQSHSFLTSWKLGHKQDILVPDIYSWEIFNADVLFRKSETADMNLFSVDDGYMSMMSGHLEYMKDIVHSNHFKDYADYLIQHKEKVYFVGTEERIRLLERYISIIYGIHLNIRKADEIPVVKGNGVRGDIEYYLYRMN